MGKGWERKEIGWEGLQEELRCKKGAEKGGNVCPSTFKEVPTACAT